MRRLKTMLAPALGAALALAPIAPAAAAGPLIPWILGRHLVGAVVGLATLPFAVASSALTAGQPAPAYPPAPAYGEGPGYYPPPNYYAAPSRYYAAPQRYSYRPEASYARSAPRFYETPRGYSAPRARYTGVYGAHVPYQSGRFAYRRR